MDSINLLNTFFTQFNDMALTALAQRITDKAKSLEDDAFRNGLSFSPEPTHPGGTQVQCRNELVDLLDELRRLVLGPQECLFDILGSIGDLLSLRAIYRYDVANNVPEEGIPFKELADKVKIDKSILSRLLRNAMINHIFYEPRADFVRHTDLSRLFQDEDFRAAIGAHTEEILPASTKSLEALEKWSGSQEPNHTGFNLLHRTESPMFIELSKEPDRARRFTGYFRALGKRGLAHDRLAKSKLWTELDVPGKLIVDVGGNRGHISQALAKVTKNLRFIVQDLPGTVDLGKEQLPVQFRDRITFQAHDFFQPQPVKGADVYFFRKVFHDWRDKYCIKILQNTIPCLKEGARVVLNERLQPETGQASYSQRDQRHTDMTMLVMCNSQERTITDWRNLFMEVDPRFQLHFETWLGCPNAMIVATWMG